jgi:hypothetical protein
VNVTEEYNKFTNDLKYSGIKRDLEEQYLKIDFNTSIKSINSFFKFGYRVSYRDEKNQTQNKYSINEIDYQQLRNLDKQKDNITNITGLYSEIMHSFSVNDTIYFDSYVSILRYDTPDEQNYSDRDELSYSVSGRYKHRFSENLSASVLFATNYLHLVYLKSQNSGSNNVNRIFRLNPKVEITFANFSMRPSFEVLANYTVYDYETANRGPESYSFRQIAYNDTIIIKADKKRSIELQNNLRYYETGKLFWDEFLESPETGNYEQFTKLMLYTTASPIVRLGIGARYHFLEQHHIFQQPGNPSSAIYSGKSIAPETEISVKFSSNSEISLQGWYEFQYIKGLEKKEIPNLFLTTKIVL